MAVSVGRIEAILELKNRMSKGLKRATSDMDKFQTKMTKMGEQATRAGAVLTAGVTVPITALAVAATRSFASFEKSMASVLAVTQATPKEFKNLTNLAKEMGETTVFTASQSAEAMRAFGLAGFSTNEIMNALRPTLNLAAAGSMDMATAADIAAKVTRGYGIAAADTTHAMDVLTKAFTTANTNLVELGNAFKMVGPVAKTAGLSFETTTAALQIMADAGIIGSMSGRQLRRALLRLVNPPGDAAKALARLGVNTVTATGRLRPFDELVQELRPHLSKTNEMAEVFGTIAMPGMVAILEKGADELRNMTKELENAEGTGQRIADVMLDNLTGAWILLTSAVEGVLLAIGKELEPLLRKLMVALTAIAHFISREVVPGFAALHPSIKLVVAGVAALLAVGAPLVLMFGMIAPALPTMIVGFKTLAAAIAIPKIAIGLLVTAVVLWIAKQAPLVRFIKALGKFFLGLGKILLKIARGAINIFIKMLEGLLNGIKDTFQFLSGGYASKVFGFFTGLVEKAGDAMMSFGETSDVVTSSQERVREAVAKLLEGNVGLSALNDAWWQLTKVGGHTEETLRDIAERAIELEDSGVQLTKGLKKLADEFRNTGSYVEDELNPVLEQTAERWETIANGWKRGAIPEAQAMMRALEDVGGITNLTVAEQKQLHSTIDTAINKYNALGQMAPQAMARIWQATRMAGHETQLMVQNIVGGISDLPTFAEAFPWLAKENQIKVSTSIDAGQIVGGVSPAGLPSVGAMMGSSLRQGFSSVMKGIPDVVVRAFEGGGGLFGALSAIGSQAGAAFGGSTLGAMGTKLASKEGAGKILKGFASMLGPIGAAVGALAGPLIKGIKKLFSGPTVAESVRKAGARMFEKGISKGLSEAIEATRKSTASDFGAMMMHMSDIIEEQGGVIAMGVNKAIRSVRDIFSAVEQGGITTAQAAKTFGEAFGLIAQAVVQSGGVASKQFVELIALAERFGISAETMKFVGEQVGLVSTGLVKMAGAGVSTKQEMEDLGIIAVASFESALAAGMSFTDALNATAPAIDAIDKAQTELGVTSDNLAIQELTNFRNRIKENGNLVAAVEALDETMLALSRTGSLNAETLAAMERQGISMYDKLIEKGFSQEQTLMLMGPALRTIMEAHEKLGIPISDNTKKIIEQAREAGALESQQKSGWKAITDAVGKLIGKMDTLIDRLMGVKNTVNAIPRSINISAKVNYRTGSMPDFDAGTGLDFSAQHGGIVTRPSIGLVGEAGPEAIIPLTHLEQRDRALLAEVRGLKSELRNLPIHLRDAILLAQ